jgi:5'(3')-deoxyribonucleotidase
MKTILIDCDDVLADWATMAIGVAKLMGIDLRESDNENWDITGYPEIAARKDEFWNILCNTPGNIKNLKKLPYADYLVEQLRKHGRVICLTSVLSGVYGSERISWLIDNFDFTIHDIILAHSKYLVNGDMFIDDKPQNIIEWSNCHNDGLGILWEYVKHDLPASSHILRARTVEKVLEYINQHDFGSK